MTAGLSIIGKRGKYIQVGVPPPDFSMTISMTNFFHNSNMLLSCIMGELPFSCETPVSCHNPIQPP